MIALFERVKRLRPPSVPPNPGGEVSPPPAPLLPQSSKLWGEGGRGEVGSPGARPLGLSFDPSTGSRRGPLSADQRGATLVTYVLVLPLLILLIFGSFAVWRIMVIRQTLFLGTYKAAWELSWLGRDLEFDEEVWQGIAESIVRTEVEGNHLIESGSTLNVAVTLPNTLDCPSDDERLIDNILFTVEATLSLPTPVRIPFLDPEPITLTERHTSFVECPRGWNPPPEEHIY
jgi:hypothetical protein